jgi:hypothetical protein
MKLNKKNKKPKTAFQIQREKDEKIVKEIIGVINTLSYPIHLIRKAVNRIYEKKRKKEELQEQITNLQDELEETKKELEEMT